MNILIAPNSFKNSLSAESTAQAIKKGFLLSNLKCHCICFPVGDGGGGTGDLLIRKFNGIIETGEFKNPKGEIIKSSFGIIDNGTTAVIEMANTSGLHLLSDEALEPLTSTSHGSGEQIKMALDKGVKKIIICMGGSATIDGGSGILSALGIRFLNSKGEDLAGLPESLVYLSTVDVTRIDTRIFACEIIVLCDVNTKLLGKNGSAAVFGPQKGASSSDIIKLEKSLKRLSEVVLNQFGIDMRNIEYGGTAGGAAAGLFAFINAKLVNGIEFFLNLTKFEKALDNCDVIVTGEGSIDDQSLMGKEPIGVAKKANLKKIPVICIAGNIPERIPPKLHQYFNCLFPIGNKPTDLHSAIKSTQFNLIRTATEIGNLLALQQKKSNDPDLPWMNFLTF